MLLIGAGLIFLIGLGYYLYQNQIKKNQLTNTDVQPTVAAEVTQTQESMMLPPTAMPTVVPPTPVPADVLAVYANGAIVTIPETAGYMTTVPGLYAPVSFENTVANIRGSVILVSPTTSHGDADKAVDQFSIKAVNNGGSGDFAYLTLLTADSSGVLKESDSEPLGDRIKLGTLKTDDLADGSYTITVTYMEHGPDQAMVDAPNTPVTKTFTVVNSKFVQ